MSDVPADPSNDTPPVEPCPHCHAPVPVGQYCGNCGATLADESDHGRLHSYAAAPHEHVLQLSVLSTLFPHLPRRHAHLFRTSLAAGSAIVVGLVAGRLFAPATVVAALVLPVLYLMYLYEVEVYQHEPVLVLALTFVSGLLLGVAYTLAIDHLAVPDISGHVFSAPVQALLLPAIAQVLMILGPLVLLSHAHFDEALDGLTFGAATALGFTLATVLASLWHVLTAPLLSDASSSDEILRLARVALLAAVVNASATGIITASLWLRYHRRRRGGRPSVAWRHPYAAATVAFGTQVALGIAGYYIRTLLALVAVTALAALALLLYLRLVIHHALLEEAAEHVVGKTTICPECHRLVPSMRFCPVCGVSRSAAPRPLRGREPGAETT